MSFNNRWIGCLAGGFLALTSLHAAATISIVNGDPAGIGFNDPTAVLPVGGNPGTTLGQQRLNAFQAAASKWGATITSVPAIRVFATWDALSCSATGAVLGSAGSTEVFRDFPGAPAASRWFGKAQTAALYGADPDPATPDIRARFNLNLGKTGCLTGIFFYLGLDNNHGNNVDLVSVLLHEFGHGLGFQTFTDGSTGTPLLGFNSVWDDFLLDTETGKTWAGMTNAERAASATKVNKLVWTGTNVTSAVPAILGSPTLLLTAPASVSGEYLVGTASFGPGLTIGGVTGEVMPVVDAVGGIGLACTALSALNATAVNGKIALIDRGTCGFNIKVKNCQNAGAIGVLIADNVAGGPPPGLGGTDITITIPSVRITQADGATLKAALATRTRTRSGMFATLKLDPSKRPGADASNRALMYTPNPFQAGSSVSHFDVTAFPNLLMEPAINGDLPHEVTTPKDLTYKLLKDIGWQ